jgi:hypothetical protein
MNLNTDDIRQRCARARLSYRVWSVLASDNQPFKIHAPEVSDWLGNVVAPRPEKIEQLMSTLADIERLVAADPLKLDMSVDNLRVAFARLAEQDAREFSRVPAIAPFDRNPNAHEVRPARELKIPAAENLLSQETK